MNRFSPPRKFTGLRSRTARLYSLRFAEKRSPAASGGSQPVRRGTGRSEVMRYIVKHGVIGSRWKDAGAAIRSAGAKGRSLMKRMMARRGGGQSGQAMAEMAFVAPVILLVLTGICSFGIALNDYELLTYGTASGARAFALARSQASWSPTAASDICEYTYDIAVAAMPTLNTSNLTMTITFTPPTGADNSGGPWTATASSGCSSFSLDGTDINGVVSITTTYPVTPILWGRSMALNLTATSAQQIQ